MKLRSTCSTDSLAFATTSSFTSFLRGTRNREFVNTWRFTNRVHVAKRKPARSLITISRVGDAVGIENNLLETISTLRGSSEREEPLLNLLRTRKPDIFHDAEQLVSDLEKTSGGFRVNNNKLKGLLPGKWRLVLTNSKAVEKNAGSITGLGSLPGAKCTRVDVILNKDGTARTVEGIEVFGGLIKGENSLEGKWRITGNGVLEVTYARAVLLGKTKIRADSKAVLRTSYCSANVRLARSASGEFYVFVQDRETA
ncbi:hypothetical protein FGB62_19g258 [Gracilaria domingensis]|nr:hypothetical protein FGB62_19g258 [Gracilaria domingensis]